MITTPTKQKLLRAAYDVTLIGDDEPVPLGRATRSAPDVRDDGSGGTAPGLRRPGPAHARAAGPAHAADRSRSRGGGTRPGRTPAGHRRPTTDRGDDVDRPGGRTRRPASRGESGAGAGPDLDAEQRAGVAPADRHPRLVPGGVRGVDRRRDVCRRSPRRLPGRLRPSCSPCCPPGLRAAMSRYCAAGWVLPPASSPSSQGSYGLSSSSSSEALRTGRTGWPAGPSTPSTGTAIASSGSPRSTLSM